ncbi:MAG: orotidine-5'-phosphate decarboxylase [Candidatus Omnitrophica bacterium]|nr:orotidine-5'-phosphate decarboxylase [Candidatus Omnitrophota bacterium]MBU4477573.1 orotidine-5'-phosphate decarboxylase [Candidatus Omnitrophota bacterium]MCG2703601.1 orotidine-5'-phosphate decarboxylase [Candidatus Omnitrophota bacterium]
MKKETQLIVALDTGSLDEAQRLVRELSACVKYFKIGSQLFTACGPRCVEMVLRENAEVFLDLKFHDIPNTVAQAAVSALRLGVFMFNVHAIGGSVMLSKVIETLNKEVDALKARRPLVLGVTVLTSMDRQQLNSVGVVRSVKNEVIHLAKLCKKNGLDGVVCSGKEINLLRRVIGEDFMLVVPGIRPASVAADDQKRIVTPADAARMGADYIVVGRPVVAAESPLCAAQEILAELHDV